MSEAVVQLKDVDEARLLYGPRDRNLRLIRERLGVQLVGRDSTVLVSGGEADTAAAVGLLQALLEHGRARGELPPTLVEELLDQVRPKPGGSPSGRLPAGGGGAAFVGGIRTRTDGQRDYIQAIERHDIVFAIGPAGTGKTFLAVLMAVQALKAGAVQRILLCRPAVEAGEKLGFLPGDYQAKVNPYMRPLYDALYAMLDFDTVKRYIEREVIEVAPLAYMRGRTLADAFIILDEAQNTTRAQMKMFLTRMGEGSKIVVTGDISQVDLPPGVTSGLIHAQSILQGVDEIAFVELTVRDIVRHRVVWKIIEAYDGRARTRKKR